MTNLSRATESGDPRADVSEFRRRALIEGDRVFDEEISESSGTSRQERRTAIDTVVDQFVARNCKVMQIFGGTARR